LCVSASMVLHYAFNQFGITSEIHAVDLVVVDERSDQGVMYGRPDPQWDNDDFDGHCVLWLPRSRRLIDATVGQFPEVDLQHGSKPIVGRGVFTALGTPEYREAQARGQVLPHAQMTVKRGIQSIVYTVVGKEYTDIVWKSHNARKNAERHRRAGLALASHALTLLRLPGVVDRIRQASYPKLNALLDAIGDAPIIADDSGNFHVTIADRSLRLDEISLPDRAYVSVPSVSAPLPHIGDDEAEIRAIVKDVETEAQLYVSTPDDLGGGPLPVVLFEPRRAVVIGNRITRQVVEFQSESIIGSGFGRLLPDTAATHLPNLENWSVRRTTDGLELWDNGGIWARAAVRLDEDWQRAADSSGQVFVVCNYSRCG
jgi:hypothetical protein